jgi:hypothetical protein
MSDEGETTERGPRRPAAGEEPPAVAHSRHSIQESGRQPADRAAYEYERGDDPGRVPRRKPGPVDEEA